MSATPSQLYPNARQLFATAQLNWLASNIKIALMADSYAPNFSNLYISEIPSASIIAASGNVPNTTAAGGVLGGDTTSLGVIVDTRLAGGLIFYKDTGTPTTSPLIAWVGSGLLPGLPAVLDGLQYFVYKNLTYNGWFRL